jgi:predicted AAA+ superfamily ATPase
MDITELILAARADLAGLTVFSPLRDHPLLGAFAALLDAAAAAPCSSAAGPGTAASGGKWPMAPGNPGTQHHAPGVWMATLDFVRSWAAFTAAFIAYSREGTFRTAIASLALTAENPFTLAAEAGGAGKLSPALRIAAAGDLDRLGRIAGFDTAALGLYLGGILRDAGLGDAAQNIEAEARAFWAAEGTAAEPGMFPPQGPWGAALPALAEHIRASGAGDLGLYRSFSWAGGDTPPHGAAAGAGIRAGAEGRGSPEGAAALLRPVRNGDPVRLADLCGYEEQRSVVIANTLRFLEGRHVNNLLLYGDRGTGKSATVKAICNEYGERGLRLLEVRKRDLLHLPLILDTLSNRPLPFIMFIDDLSFETIDDSFTGLKALLEGGAEARPSNVVVYATSNRRHLVKERIADRPALAAGNPADGEVRAFDTMQEQFSLADRFGLTVVFTAPSQEEYLNIACFIAEKRGILKSAEEDGSAQAGEARQLFRANALRWEKWFNGRSPRTAAQYVDWAAAGAGFPWE